MDSARAVDTIFGLIYDDAIPGYPPKRDLWLETIDMARASFAVAALIASPTQFAYDDENVHSTYGELFAGRDDFRTAMDEAVLHDAVVNTATAWTHIWTKVSKN
jgi:hypothetical protein